MDAWEQSMFDRDFAAALTAAGDDPHRVVLALCALGRALETRSGDESALVAAVLGDAGRSPELDAGATAVGIVVRTKSKEVDTRNVGVDITMKGRAHTVSRPRTASSPPIATADTTGVVIQVGPPTDIVPDAKAATRAKRLTTPHTPEPDTDEEGAVEDDPWASLAMKVQAEIAAEEARSVAAVDIVKLAADDPASAMSLPVASDDEEDPWRSLAMKVHADEARPDWTAINVHPDDLRPDEVRSESTSVDLKKPESKRPDSEPTSMRTPLTPDPDAQVFGADAMLSFADDQSVPNAVPRAKTPEPTASIGTVIRGERPSEPDIEMSFDDRGTAGGSAAERQRGGIDAVPARPRTRTDQKFANVVRRNDSSGGIVLKPADEAQDKTPVSGMVVPFKPDIATATAPALSDTRSLRDAAIDAAFTRAIATADTWLEPEDPLRARARLEANVFLARVNRYPEAIARIREALAMVEAARGANHAEAADVLVTLGYRLLEGATLLPGKPLEDCERCLSRAISILENAPDRVQRLDTARGYLAAVRRHREHAVVRDLRRMLAEHRLVIKFSDGTATLSGAVRTEAARAAAIATAKEHQQVRSVVSDIAIGEPQAPKV